jgi:hypothetical protein
VGGKTKPDLGVRKRVSDKAQAVQHWRCCIGSIGQRSSLLLFSQSRFFAVMTQQSGLGGRGACAWSGSVIPAMARVRAAQIARKIVRLTILRLRLEQLLSKLSLGVETAWLFPSPVASRRPLPQGED